MEMLSTLEAAEKLGISSIRIRQLIQDGKIKAKKLGRDYVIEESELENVKIYGKAGRPVKPAADKA
jgi:excisionase family DNA binding protein